MTILFGAIGVLAVVVGVLWGILAFGQSFLPEWRPDEDGFSEEEDET